MEKTQKKSRINFGYKKPFSIPIKKKDLCFPHKNTEGGCVCLILLLFWRVSLMILKLVKRIAYVALINTYEANKNDRIVGHAKSFMN